MSSPTNYPTTNEEGTAKAVWNPLASNDSHLTSTRDHSAWRNLNRWATKEKTRGQTRSYCSPSSWMHRQHNLTCIFMEGRNNV